MDSNLAELAKQIIDKLPQTARQTVVVMDFSDLNGKNADLVNYAAEELTMQLINAGKCDVIERQLVGKVAQENNLNLSKGIDPGTAKTLGKYLGVSVICTGSIFDLGNTKKLYVRLISAQSGSPIVMLSQNIESTTANVSTSDVTPSSPDSEKTANKETPPGSILNVGESWVQGGAVLRLLDSTFLWDLDPEGMRVTFYVANTSGKRLLLNINQDSFTAVDNRNRKLSVGILYKYLGYLSQTEYGYKPISNQTVLVQNQYDGSGGLDWIDLLNGESVRMSTVKGFDIEGDSDYLIRFPVNDSTITSIILTVNIGPIRNARWKIVI